MWFKNDKTGNQLDDLNEISTCYQLAVCKWQQPSPHEMDSMSQSKTNLTYQSLLILNVQSNLQKLYLIY
jgi:hypothetical protein